MTEMRTIATMILVQLLKLTIRWHAWRSRRASEKGLAMLAKVAAAGADPIWVQEQRDRIRRKRAELDVLMTRLEAIE